MFRTIITTAAAAAIALTGFTATPAQADDDDLVRFLAGVATIYVIGKAIESNNDKNRWKGGNRWDDDYWKREASRYRRYPSIPGRCVTDIRTRHGRMSVVGERCLERSGYKSPLPRICEMEVRTERGRRDVYDTSCLMRAGLRISHR